MSARGEFNFQIAEQAHKDAVLSDDYYAGVREAVVTAVAGGGGQWGWGWGGVGGRASCV